MVKRITKSELLQIGQVQLTHKWDLEILRLPAVPGILSESAMRLTARSVNIPKYDIEMAEFNKQGMKWSEPVNVNTSGEWSYTCYELEDSNVRKFMVAYHNALKQGTLSRRDGSMDFKISSKNRNDRTNMIYIVKNYTITSIDIPEMGSDATFMEITVNGNYMDLDIRGAL